MTSDMYERVNFGPGPVDEELLNKLASNADYLYEHMVTGYYNILGTARETGLNFRVGNAKLIGTSDWIQSASVYFNKPFLPGIRPAIFLSSATDAHFYFHLATRGLDGRAIADHRGFQLFVGKTHDWPHEQFAGEQYVSYLAIAPSG